jgi:catechol 2,3-dioxygenase-like lactoylglutathione lyase family enzyme
MKGMLEFYCGTMGLKIAFTLNHDDGTPFGYYLECGHMTFIEIFDQRGSVKQWGGACVELAPGTRYRHFCCEVTDLQGYTDMLKTKGITVSAITVGMDNSRQAWVKDPDGNDIELMEYTRDSLQLAPQRT